MTEEQLETIKKLLECGIIVELVLVDNEIAYRVSGFASSGYADLVPSEQCLLLHKLVIINVMKSITLMTYCI